LCRIFAFSNRPDSRNVVSRRTTKMIGSVGDDVLVQQR
jgi:hypothetical protein